MQNERALKVLSKYFPYGLRITSTDDLTVDTMVRDLTKEYIVTSAANRYPLEKVLPLLRSFDQLFEPINYRGNSVIPAKEIAKLAVDLVDHERNTVDMSGPYFPGERSHVVHVHCFETDTVYHVYFWKDGFTNDDSEIIGVSCEDTDISVKNLLYIIDLLHELQFAVGLSDSEYCLLPVEAK